MDNKFDVILHVLQKRNIWMKNKKKPFCEHAQRTDAYVTGEQKGFDAVIRQIARFLRIDQCRTNLLHTHFRAYPRQQSSLLCRRRRGRDR